MSNTSNSPSPEQSTSSYDRFLDALIELRQTDGPWEGGWPISTQYDPHRPSWAPSYTTVVESAAYSSWADAIEDARIRAGDWTRGEVDEILRTAATSTPGPEKALHYADYRLYRARHDEIIPSVEYLTTTFDDWRSLVTDAGLEVRGWLPGEPTPYATFMQAITAIWRVEGDPPTVKEYIDTHPRWAPSCDDVYDLDAFEGWKTAIADAEELRQQSQSPRLAAVTRAAEDTPGDCNALSCLDYRRYRQLQIADFPTVRELCSTPADWPTVLTDAGLTPTTPDTPLSGHYKELIDAIMATHEIIDRWPTRQAYRTHAPSWAPPIEEGLAADAGSSWDAAVTDAYAVVCDRQATGQVSISRSRDSGSE